MIERQALIVYFKHVKSLKDIKKLGNLVYYHKKRKYAVLYVNKEDVPTATKSLKALRNIKYVDQSYLDQSVYAIDFSVK